MILVTSSSLSASLVAAFSEELFPSLNLFTQSSRRALWKNCSRGNLDFAQTCISGGGQWCSSMCKEWWSAPGSRELSQFSIVTQIFKTTLMQLKAYRHHNFGLSNTVCRGRWRRWILEEKYSRSWSRWKRSLSVHSIVMKRIINLI